jgi:hypothetical protein
LNVRSRSEVLALVERQFPERDPRATIFDWVMELSHQQDVDTPEWNALALKLNGNALDVLRRLLDGLSLDQLVEDLGEEFEPDHVAASRAGIATLCAALQRSSLAPLFTNLPLVQPARTALPG